MKLFIFGSTGDLVKRKVMKALQELRNPELKMFAIGRREMDRKEYQEFICSDWCSLDFRNRIDYIKVNFSKLNPKEFEKYLDKEKINFFYISLPPSMQKKIFEFLSELLEKYKIKVLIEKPFGESNESAIELKEFLDKSGMKEHIIISDHYLFKKGFSDIKAKNPKKIKIVSHETLGLEGRHGYYDSVGAMRDMVQSHFLNLILKNLKIKLNPETITVNKVEKGQYKDYNKELGKDSKTETFVRIEFEADGKKFELSTGKSMKNKETFIEIDEEKFHGGDENSYVEAFRRFLSLDFSKFPTPEESILGWEILEKMENSNSKDSKLLKYEKNSDSKNIKSQKEF